MADVIKEYAIQIQVQGSKAVIKSFKELEGVEKKQNKQLKETNSLLWTYAKRLVGIYAIYKMFRKGLNLGVSFAEQGNSLKTLSSMANVSTKSLQRWGNAIRRIGGDSKSVASIMGDINQRIYNRRFNKDEFKELATKYGPDTYLNATNAEDFLIGISRKLQQYKDENAKNDILAKAGITDAYFGRFLKAGPEEVMKALKQAEVLYSDKDIADAEKAKQQLFDFNIQLEKLATALGKMSLQPLTNLIKELTNFLQDPKKYIKNALSQTETSRAGIITTAVNSLSPVNLGKTYAKGIGSLLNFSATSGREGYLDFTDEMTKRIFGKDYAKYMSLFGGVGSGLYAGAGQYLDKGIDINNDISVTLNGTTEPIADKIGDAFDKTKEKTIATVKQSLGINY